MYSGRITEIIQRTQKRFVGSLVKQARRVGRAARRQHAHRADPRPRRRLAAHQAGHEGRRRADPVPRGRGAAGRQGVITEVLGKAGEKDVDLKSGHRPVQPARGVPRRGAGSRPAQSLDSFDPEDERTGRLDLTDEVDLHDRPDDAKDYDDAISLQQLDNGHWELGVHIADVAYFVPEGTPLDVEAEKRGNSCYFPGYVIPMLPEILSNGVCSLQEARAAAVQERVHHLRRRRPARSRTRFANTVIKSRKRLRYREAQAIIDHADDHPAPRRRPARRRLPAGGASSCSHNMNVLAKRLQKRRHAAGPDRAGPAGGGPGAGRGGQGRRCGRRRTRASRTR